MGRRTALCRSVGRETYLATRRRRVELQVWRDSIDGLITTAARAIGADDPLGAPRRRTQPQAHRPGGAARVRRARLRRRPPRPLRRRQLVPLLPLDRAGQPARGVVGHAVSAAAFVYAAIYYGAYAPKDRQSCFGLAGDLHDVIMVAFHELFRARAQVDISSPIPSTWPSLQRGGPTGSNSNEV